jgi:hypothetical protein
MMESTNPLQPRRPTHIPDYIAVHRPLDQISDPDGKGEAEQVRTWFTEEFLDALMD